MTFLIVFGYLSVVMLAFLSTLATITWANIEMGFTGKLGVTYIYLVITGLLWMLVYKLYPFHITLSVS